MKTLKYDDLRFRPFLVIEIMASPNDHARTERKNWKEEKESQQVQDVYYVVDRLAKRHLQRAEVIIDINNDKLVKNRFGLKHYGANLEAKKERLLKRIEVATQKKSVGSKERPRSRLDTLQKKLRMVEAGIASNKDMSMSRDDFDMEILAHYKEKYSEVIERGKNVFNAQKKMNEKRHEKVA